ncbi:GIY-YIG nuclease family protein [Candidatus Kuenenbacteria bacterium]|nr:GIY-YIG nuclease family protein [Candidatus Kuenenbacteria bacterium]
MSHVVYVIQCDEGKYYIGSTNDIARRLIQHNTGRSRWTSKYKNWKLVYQENFESKTESIKREKVLKKMKGGDAFKKIINNAG